MSGVKRFIEAQEAEERDAVEAVARRQGAICSVCGCLPQTAEELGFFLAHGRCPGCYTNDMKD